MRQLLRFAVFGERFLIVAFVNVIIPKGLFAGTPNRWLIEGAVVPSAPGRTEQISSMFYFNRCV